MGWERYRRAFPAKIKLSLDRLVSALTTKLDGGAFRPATMAATIAGSWSGVGGNRPPYRLYNVASRARSHVGAGAGVWGLALAAREVSLEGGAVVGVGVVNRVLNLDGLLEGFCTGRG